MSKYPSFKPATRGGQLLYEWALDFGLGGVNEIARLLGVPGWRVAWIASNRKTPLKKALKMQELFGIDPREWARKPLPPTKLELQLQQRCRKRQSKLKTKP